MALPVPTTSTVLPNASPAFLPQYDGRCILSGDRFYTHQRVQRVELADGRSGYALLRIMKAMQFVSVSSDKPPVKSWSESNFALGPIAAVDVPEGATVIVVSKTGAKLTYRRHSDKISGGGKGSATLAQWTARNCKAVAHAIYTSEVC